MSGATQEWLTLLHAPDIGPVTCRRLLERFGEPGKVLAAGRELLREAGLKDAAIDALRNPDPRMLEQDLAWLDGADHHLISIRDPDYPALLAAVPDPPPLLFVIGDPGLLANPQLAIVGSRNPTSGGSRTAREFARFLAASGLTITSGLAIGIDAAGHEGALASGSTIAVSGTGPDRIYPAANRELAHRIAARGALVTELPPGTAARREHFPRRNRIISGLSVGTLVVEAAARSGSLITARMASEQGREVFAIPGSIHNPLARGCHALIRQGAKLVETAGDIIEELGPLLGSLDSAAANTSPAAGTAAEPSLDADYLTLLKCLGHDPVAPDVLIRCSGFSAAVISSMLLMLELEGHVVSVPGGRYSRTVKAVADNP
jgi:DNA processing protein